MSYDPQKALWISKGARKLVSTPSLRGKKEERTKKGGTFVGNWGWMKAPLFFNKGRKKKEGLQLLPHGQFCQILLL